MGNITSEAEKTVYNVRCEHNCHLCEQEFLGRCHGSLNYGKDVSLAGETDLPICAEYKYHGTARHLVEIELAEKLGVRYLEKRELEKLLTTNEGECECINCHHTFKGLKVCNTDINSDIVACPKCGTKMGVLQEVKYTCYSLLEGANKENETAENV